MDKVTVVSRKFDGTLRDEHTTHLVSETDEIITLFSPPKLRYWDHRKGAWFETDDGLIEIYPKQRWYNVWHICEQVSRINHTYINIATPATLESGCLLWTDLDLDFRVQMDYSVVFLDEDEYRRNARVMGYPAHVMAQAEAACREVEQGLRHGVYPFDHAEQVAHYAKLKALNAPPA